MNLGNIIPKKQNYKLKTKNGAKLVDPSSAVSTRSNPSSTTKKRRSK